MGKLIFGAHVSIADGFTAAALFAREKLSANALQIFAKSPRSNGKSKLTESEAKDYRAAAKSIFTVIHCSYLLNFAKDLSQIIYPLENLIDDLHTSEMLGAAGVILHVGKHLNLSRGEGIAWVVKNLQFVLEKTKALKSAVILEITAGQGSELGNNFAELREIYIQMGKPKRIKFCFDTCHAFAAGYDLRDAARVKKVFTELDKTLGIKNLSCIHFNDALMDFNSKVDRHANLGEGKIGKAGLIAVAQFAQKNSVPLILETPERNGKTHLQDLKKLRSWLK
ncbi:MAG: deoxyribonuclease IV [Candidatus Gracilibacteria bacterium]